MKGGGGCQPIPDTNSTHTSLMERGMSDVGDVVEGGHLRVGGEEPQVIPPLSKGSVSLKGERRMVPLWFLSREVLVDGNHIHAKGAVDMVG